MQKFYRALVLLSLGLYVLWYFFPYLEPFIYAPDRLELWDNTGYDAKIDFPIWYFYLWFAFWAFTTIGLYFYSRLCRTLFFLGYLLGPFLAEFHGSTIQSPLSGAINTLNVLTDGAVLGLAYFSSVGLEFRSKAN